MPNMLNQCYGLPLQELLAGVMLWGLGFRGIDTVEPLPTFNLSAQKCLQRRENLITLSS